MGKIATEQEAYGIGVFGNVILRNKCCTKKRASELGCDTNTTTNYTSNKLVQLEDLVKAENGYDPINAPIGVFIHHTNGLLYPISQWASSENNEVVGINVKGLVGGYFRCFTIAPVTTNVFIPVLWGPYNTIIENCNITTNIEQARLDIDSKSNTNALIKGIGATLTRYAANSCRKYTFKNKKSGELPSAGILFLMGEYFDEIEECLKLVKGDTLKDPNLDENYSYWSSTQFNNEHAWFIDFKDCKLRYGYKSNEANMACRPIYTLPYF